MRITLFLALAGALMMEAAPLTGPMPGYLLDARTNSIRPVFGMPGAMQMGSAVNLPFAVVSADFGPDGNSAVVISAEQPAHLYVIRSLDVTRSLAKPIAMDLGTVSDGASVLSINASGNAAVILSPGQIQFVTGLANTPALSVAVPASALLGPISAGVLDNAGQCALLGTSLAGVGAVETLCADGTSQRLSTQAGMNISAIALANQGQDLMVADVAGKQILRLSGYAQAPLVTTVATVADGLSNPIGIQVAGDIAIVADAGTPAVFTIDLTGSKAVQVSVLDVPPARLKFLADRNILLLSDPSAALFTIFQLSAMQSYFVPTN